jgi:hypothetical protein
MDEIARCYELVSLLGRGAVYLGSSRVPATHPHYHQTAELAREASFIISLAHVPASISFLYCYFSASQPNQLVRCVFLVLLLLSISTESTCEM